MTTTGARGAIDLADLDELFGDDAARRRAQGRVGRASSRRVATCAAAAATRARARVDLLAARAGAQPGDGLLGGAHPALGGLHALARHVPPASPHRLAACASRRWPASSASKRCEVRFGGSELGLRGLHFVARGLRLRLGLPDVLGPRAGLQQPQLRLGLPRSARARSTASSVSRASRRRTSVPASTRSPSLTRESTMRPPTSGASRTSVASTWPDTRTWLATVLPCSPRRRGRGGGAQDVA